MHSLEGFIAHVDHLVVSITYGAIDACADGKPVSVTWIPTDPHATLQTYIWQFPEYSQDIMRLAASPSPSLHMLRYVSDPMRVDTRNKFSAVLFGCPDEPVRVL